MSTNTHTAVLPRPLWIGHCPSGHPSGGVPGGLPAPKSAAPGELFTPEVLRETAVKCDECGEPGRHYDAHGYTCERFTIPNLYRMCAPCYRHCSSRRPSLVTELDLDCEVEESNLDDPIESAPTLALEIVSPS